MSEASTPLMQQYNAVKARYPHALLLFRLGDFYELFYEDAIIASRELQITLTSRNREKGSAIPDVRRALSRGGRLHRAADSRRLQSGDLRTDGAAGAGEETGAARSVARYYAGNRDRRGGAGRAGK